MSDEKRVWTVTEVRASLTAYDAMCKRAVREGLENMPLREVDLSAMADEVIDALIDSGYMP